MTVLLFFALATAVNVIFDFRYLLVCCETVSWLLCGVGQHRTSDASVLLRPRQVYDQVRPPHICFLCTCSASAMWTFDSRVFLAAWLGGFDVSLWLADFPYDLWLTCDHFVGSVCCGSTNQANSAFHPSRVSKWVVINVISWIMWVETIKQQTRAVWLQVKVRERGPGRCSI